MLSVVVVSSLFVYLFLGVFVTLDAMLTSAVAVEEGGEDTVLVVERKTVFSVPSMMITLASLVLVFGAGSSLFQFFQTLPFFKGFYFDAVWRFGNIQSGVSAVVGYYRHRAVSLCRRCVLLCSCGKKQRGRDETARSTRKGSTRQLELGEEGEERVAAVEREERVAAVEREERVAEVEREERVAEVEREVI